MNKKIFAVGCLGIIVVGAIVIGAWLMSSYNTLVTKQEKAKTEWSNIDVILKRNQQELNSLVKILRSCVAPETGHGDPAQSISEIRASGDGADSVAAAIAAVKEEE